MVVGLWEAGPAALPDAAQLRRLVGLWRECAPAEGDLPTDLVAALPAAALAGLPELMRRELDDWAGAVVALDVDELADLVRFFAVVEAQVSGCEVGKRSPAIACARELRARGAYPASLTPWLRKHSSNRFLPYGSLLDVNRSAAVPAAGNPASEPKP